MRKYILPFIMLIAGLSILSIGIYQLGERNSKLITITKEIKVVDTELLNNYLSLQAEYNKLLTEYTTFAHHLETYERGVYDGNLRAKGINPEEYKFEEVEE